jgi:hypothetical protein
MKRFILVLVCTLSTAFFVKAVGFEKLPIGSEGVLRHYLVTNSTGVSINGFQTLDDGSENWLSVFGKTEKYKTFEALDKKVETYLTNVVTSAHNNAVYDPTLPVQVLFSVSRAETYLDYEGNLQGHLAETLYGVGTEENLTDIQIQFTRNGIPLKFYGNEKQVVKVRMEVLDRKRFDPNFVGPLFYRYKDTWFDPTENDVWIGSSDFGDAIFEEQFLINGGPKGPWDVWFEFTFADGSVRHYDGNGDPTTPKRLYVYRDGTLEVVGALPGEEVVIQTANSLEGPWFPDPEKIIKVTGQAPATTSSTERRSNASTPSEPPVRIYRIP